MKVYISVDFEGISGISTKAQLDEGNKEYNDSCILLSKEVSSLVAGLYDSGIEDIYVFDAHGGGHNILPEYMHEKAHYIEGNPGSKMRFPFLDNTFDFMILQGYHAMAGT